MRYSEKELTFLAKLPAEKAAQLHMRGPRRGDAVKNRLVKLVVNFLFYFRIDEEEPAGALLLEQCKIQREEEACFSLVFVDEPERKFLFWCGSKEQCEEWIEALTKASYEHMRKSLISYRHKIKEITGEDPLEQYGISEETRFQI